MHAALEAAGWAVASSAVLTASIAVWSLLPRPRRIIRAIRHGAAS